MLKNFSDKLGIIGVSSLLLVTGCAAGASLGLGGGNGGSNGAGNSGGGSGANGSGGYVAGGGDGAGGGPVAAPTKFSDIGWLVMNYSKTYSAAWSIDKFITFNMSPACLEAVAASADVAHKLSFLAGDIEAFAKLASGESWSAIESQNNSDRENNKHLLEPIMDAFKSSLHITLNYEGETCVTNSDALWLKALGTVSTSLEDYPPASRKAFVTINVSPSFRETKAKVADDGATFEIQFPRDIQPSDWSGPIYDAFKRVSTK